MSERQEKVQQQLQAHIATFVLHEANTDPLITVTHVDVSPDLKNAMVYFTTIPENKQDAALAFMKRSGGEIRRFVKDHMSMKTIPHFDFSVDYGERHRQHIDEIVRDTGTPETEYKPEEK